MPFYKFSVRCDLSDEEKQQIVDKVVHMHTRRFHVATIIVNVAFTDIRGAPTVVYHAGHRHEGNMAECYLRPGGRDRKEFQEVCLEVVKLWDDVLNGGKAKGNGERGLDGVVVHTSIAAGYEHGFLVPAGGTDREWLRDNRQMFEGMAAEGDKDVQFLLEELKTRPDLAPDAA